MKETELLLPVILRNLRGNMTQKYVAQHLGCNELNVSRWETARRACSYKDFLALCTLAGRDFSMCLHHVIGYRDSIQDVVMLLQRCTTGISISDLAKRVETPESTLRRWLDGKTTPSTLEILTLLDTIFKGLLYGIIWNLFPKTPPQAWGKNYALYHSLMGLRLKFPAFTTILKFLRLNKINNPENYIEKISDLFDISQHEIKAIAGELIKQKFIPYTSPQSQMSYEFINFLSPHFKIKNAEGAFLNISAAKYLLEKKDMMHNRSVNIYTTIEVSEKARRDITDLRISFMNRYEEILRNDQPRKKDFLMLLNLNNIYLES